MGYLLLDGSILVSSLVRIYHFLFRTEIERISFTTVNSIINIESAEMTETMNLLDTPTYSPNLAASLVGLSPGRVRRWLRGYQYSYTSVPGNAPETREIEPVVHRRGAEGSSYASFLDIIDLLFVKEFINAGLSLQRLRLALNEASQILGGKHFARRSFWTDGHQIFLQVKDSSVDSLLQLLSGGQWVIAPVIQETARQIDFSESTDLAEKWFPLGRKKPIVLDPKIAFGFPSIVKRGILTSNIYDLFKAEQESIERVGSWMNIRNSEVQAAVEFERMLNAA